MQPDCEYFTVAFGSDVVCIPLPKIVPRNFHAFVRDELVAAGVQGIPSKEMQVCFLVLPLQLVHLSSKLLHVTGASCWHEYTKSVEPWVCCASWKLQSKRAQPVR